MSRILVADSIAEAGIAFLRDHVAGFDVDVKLGMSPEELAAAIGAYEAVIVRSATKIRGELLPRQQCRKQEPDLRPFHPWI